MTSKAGQLSVSMMFGLVVAILLAFGSETAVSGPLKRGSTGPTSQPPPPPPKEVKQEETSEYVYRDTRMIRVPILPPFPIF
jgi:hypothetical protein